MVRNHEEDVLVVCEAHAATAEKGATLGPEDVSAFFLPDPVDLLRLCIPDDGAEIDDPQRLSTLQDPLFGLSVNDREDRSSRS